jgi:hypothetical protein
MRTEEPARIVIIEGQSGGASTQRISRQVGFSGDQSGLQVRVPISTVPYGGEYALQVCHVTDEHTCIGAEWLFEA